MARSPSHVKEQVASMTDDIGPREAALVSDFLGVVRLALYVLAAIGGAGLGAEHFGLI